MTHANQRAGRGAPRRSERGASISGVVTALTGLVTAAGGLLVALNQFGVLGDRQRNQPRVIRDTVVVRSTPEVVRDTVVVTRTVTSVRDAAPDRRVLARRRDEISGTYRGAVLNQTYGGTANLLLIVNRQSSGMVTGSIRITGELIGSGRIEGRYRGNSLRFTSVAPDTGILITWNGILAGNTIEGTYVVPVQPKLGLYVEQQGVWRVSQRGQGSR